MTDLPSRSGPTRSGRALSKAHAVELRRALELRRAHLLRAHEEYVAHISDEEPESGDRADVAEGIIEDRQRAAMEEHDRALLAEIEHALAKFDAGVYGVSEKTGRPIPFKRLLAIPWARYDSAEAKEIERAAQ